MLKNMKIGTRLAVTFGLMMFLLLVNGVMAINVIITLNGHMDKLVHDRLPKVEQANLIIKNININARALRNVLIDPRDEIRNEELKRIRDAQELTRHDRCDTEREAFLSEKRIAAIPAAERPDRLLFREMDDIFIVRVAGPGHIFLAGSKRSTYCVNTWNKIAIA